MGWEKDSKPLKRWLILFISAIFVGALSIIIDITWIKKTLWVILLLIGFVASGSMYEIYENNIDKIGKGKNSK